MMMVRAGAKSGGLAWSFRGEQRLYQGTLRDVLN